MKLSIIVKTIANRLITLSYPISMKFSANSFIPCDSMELTLELQYPEEKFAEITASLDDSEFFSGIVDSQQLIVSNNGKLLKLCCRSKTALMVDNEVKPYIYFQLTSTQLFDRYARPFGIISHEFPYEAKKNFIQVRKGMSYWHVIDEYCRLVYRKSAYVTHDKRLVLSPINNNDYTLSNTVKGAIPYSSISINRLPYKLVSKVYLKTATETYGYAYGVAVDNSNAVSQKVKRERFYHPISKISKDAKAEIDEIIKESNRNAFSIDISIPALVGIHIGDRIKLYDSLYTANSSLAVCSISYTINQDGICTKITLSDTNYM